MVEHSQSAGPAGVVPPEGRGAAEKLPEAFAIAANHLLAGRMKQAEAACRSLTQDHPSSARAHQLLGDVLQRTGRAATAVASFEQAIRLNPSFSDAYLGLGNALYQLERFAEAEGCYRRALAIRPGFFEASQNLASTLKALGRQEEAIRQFEKTREIKPDAAIVHINLGSLLHSLGRNEEAAACFKRALALEADRVEVLNNLGAVLSDMGRAEEAEACYRRAIALKPAFVVPYNNLANLLQARGRHKDAIAYYDRGLRIDPKLPELHNNLGNAYKSVGRLDQAEACFRRALELRPRFAAAHNNLASVLQGQGKLEAARASYRHALTLDPNFAEAYSNLGNVVRELGRLREAEEAYRRCLALIPNSVEALNNLGTVLKDSGRFGEAEMTLRQALSLRPDFGVAYHNLLMCMQYDPSVSPEALLKAHREFDRRFALPLRPACPQHGNEPLPDRRLRVGYVSGDMARHPVGHFLAPVLAAHDRSQVEIFAYSDRLTEDDMTVQLRSQCDHWRRIVDLDDEALANRIRADRIDILVDLSGHTADNRLLAFARKPAPVQVTWAGYVGTTGMSAIDYLISDEQETPKGCEGESTETVIRLPDCYLCYSPPSYAPEVGPPPALKAGRVTFGCFNNLTKVNSSVIALWAELLGQLPESRLMLKTHQLDDAGMRNQYADLFASHGVDPGRLILQGRSPHRALLLAYNEIDIALDPFPYSGGLTTLESLWMGVPVVTKRGDRFAARHSASHLTAVGLPELIAPDAEGYIAIARGLAEDLQHLGELRSGLRGRMAASPLCDGARFARNLEAAYRNIWRNWCESRHRHRPDA